LIHDGNIGGLVVLDQDQPDTLQAGDEMSYVIAAHECHPYEVTVIAPIRVWDVLHKARPTAWILVIDDASLYDHRCRFNENRHQVPSNLCRSAATTVSTQPRNSGRASFCEQHTTLTVRRGSFRITTAGT
jgi:hypothetical protein